MIAPLVSKLLLLLYHGYRGVSNSPFFPRRPFPVLAGRKSRVLFEHTHKADVSVIAAYLGYLFHGQGSGGKVILPRLYPCRNDILVAADPELLFVHRLKIGRAEIYPVRQLPDGAKSPRIAVNIRSQLPQLLTVGVFAVTAFASALGYFHKYHSYEHIGILPTMFRGGHILTAEYGQQLFHGGDVHRGYEPVRLHGVENIVIIGHVEVNEMVGVVAADGLIILGRVLFVDDKAVGWDDDLIAVNDEQGGGLEDNKQIVP